jgi:DNA polymerase (family 10)
MSAPYKIVKNGDEPRWFVSSAEGTVYLVQEKRGGGLRCDCKGYKYRQDCRHIHMIDYQPPKRFPHVTIEYLGNSMVALLSDGAKKIEIVGSFRRGLPDSKDIDIIVLGNEYWWMHQCVPGLQSRPNVEIEQFGNLQIRGIYCGLPFDVSRVDEEDDWVWYLLYRTGSKEFNIEMRKRARELGWKMNEHGLFLIADGSRLPFWPDTEQEVFEKLEMEYRPPKER